MTKPSDLLEIIIACIEESIALCIEGEAGVGKSQLIAQACRQLNRRMIDQRGAQMDATDIRGLPEIDHKAHTSRWAPPEWLPRDPDSTDVIFFDEINRGTSMVQNSMLQLTLDRKCGDYVLPAGCAVLAACNPDTHRGVNKMSEALANRFEWAYFTLDLEDWTKWALDNDVEPELIAFLRFRPTLLHAYDRNSTEKAFPSPRSWVDRVDKVLKRKVRPEIELAMFEGAVGSGPAGELAGFLQIYRQLPSLDGILMNPDKAKVPGDAGPCLAIASGLARKATAANFDRVITYVDRMPAEWGVYCVKDSARLTPDVEHTRAFIKWASEHQDIMG